MFAELRERNPTVHVRYRRADGQATEEDMSILKYHRWLATAPSHGYTIELVEMTKRTGI